MSISALCDVVARPATEPDLAAELDADPEAFGPQRQLAVDEFATQPPESKESESRCS
jgi:hypothetical protein